MNAADAQVPAAVASQAPAIARAITEISDRMRRGGRLIYSGAGTSGRLGVLDAAECPPTFSVPPGMVIGVIAGGQRALTTAVEGAEDDSQQGAADLQALGLTPLDSVMGIATSGRTPYVLGAVAAARAAGCLTLGLACNSGAALASAAALGGSAAAAGHHTAGLSASPGWGIQAGAVGGATRGGRART
ncbi:MAG: N-acetylmuramic acid 6-phosphate etherase, partial [Planctomyces sp.]